MSQFPIKKFPLAWVSARLHIAPRAAQVTWCICLSMTFGTKKKTTSGGAPQIFWAGKGFVRLSQAEFESLVVSCRHQGMGKASCTRAPGCVKLSHRMPQGPFMPTQCVPRSGPVTSAEMGIKLTTKPCEKLGNPLFWNLPWNRDAIKKWNIELFHG